MEYKNKLDVTSYIGVFIISQTFLVCLDTCHGLSDKITEKYLAELRKNVKIVYFEPLNFAIAKPCMV
jgi:hypothetical protein